MAQKLMLLGCLLLTSTACEGTATHAASSDTGAASSTGGTTGAGSTSTSGGTTTGGDIWTRDGGVTVTVTTLAGDGSAGFRDGSGGHDGTARFEGPNGLAIDSQGNVYIADTLGHRIRKIDSSGNVTTLAGNGAGVYQDGSGGANGTASFGSPSGLAISSQGFLLVTDDGVNRVRQVDLTDGTTTTFAGNGSAGFVDGSGGASGKAEFNFSDDANLAYSGMCGDGNDHFFVADPTNNAIRTIDGSGNVGTLAGNGSPGAADGSGGRSGGARFNAPGSCAVDSLGNVYVADFGNNRIRKIDSSGNVTTLAGNGIAGHRDGSGGAHGTTEFHAPAGVAVDPTSGTVFAPDTFEDFVRHIAADGTTTTLAGDGTGWRDGSGGQAQFDAPAGMAVDSQGRLVVVDFFGYDVRILSFK